MKILLLALLLFPAKPARSAVAPLEVGVEEHLGAALPLGLHFTDEDGRSVALGSLIRKPTILTLNFFSCAGICTPLLNGLVDGLNDLPLEAGQAYQVLTVSFDPNDAPLLAKMKRQNYLRQISHPFPAEAWRFLTGQPKNIQALTEAVGFKYKAAPSGQYVHPAVIVILSPKGQITRYMYGIDFPPQDLQMALIEAARGQVRASVVKTLRFCYDYDPAGRVFVSRVTRVVGAASLLLALALIGAFSFRRRRKS